jgi:hypothetical protein
MTNTTQVSTRHQYNEMIIDWENKSVELFSYDGSSLTVDFNNRIIANHNEIHELDQNLFKVVASTA